jgi:predicted anti-sigma-YlaC factor YlaD
MGQFSFTDCGSLREQISASLDGEITELERARLDAHLGVCAACRAYASDAGAAAQLMRQTPLEPVTVPFVLPSRRLALARRVQVGAAAATLVATVGLGVMLGGSGTPATRSHTRSTAQTVKLQFPEQELRMLHRSSQPRSHARIAL